MPVGICKLCQNEKSLALSHFLPARLYEYCKQGQLSPIKLGDGVVYPTDRQTQAHLLCHSCEDVLNAGGETWINPRLATWERTFPLFDLLLQKTPDYGEDGLTVFHTASNPEVKADKLVHFAMGIFWKASVHSWSGSSKSPVIDLGPYSDRIRKWLLSEAKFPDHVYISAVVATPGAAQIVLLEPYRTHSGWHTYMLHVPGLLLMLDIGKTVEPSTRWASLAENTLKPIMVGDEVFMEIGKLMASALHRSRKTKAYESAMEKVSILRKQK